MPAKLTVAGLAVWLLVALAASAATPYYLDVNGSLPGCGVTNGGVYDAGGTNWTTDSTGGSAAVTFAGRSTPVFSAGTDASGLTYTITGNIGQTSGGMTFAEGNVNFIAGGSFFGGGTVQTLAGAGLNFAPPSPTWDFYGQTMTFNTAAGTTIVLNSIATASGRTGGVIKTGPGLMVITGAASARGITVMVNTGELRIQNANALFTPGYGANVTVTNGGSLELSNNITISSNPLTISGSGDNNLGALANDDNNNNFNSLITLAGASRINNNAAGTTLTLHPASGSAITGAFDLTLGGAGNLNLYAPVDALTSLSKDGAGTVTFSALNTYPGPTTNGSGTMRWVEGAGVLGGVAGSLINNATLIISNTAAQSLTNVVSGGANGQFVKQGSGALTLTAASPYTGATVISAGRLVLGPGAALGNSALITTTNGATLDISAVGGFTLNAGQTLAGSGVVTGAVMAASGARLSPGFGSVAGTLSFSNTLTLAGGVTNLFKLSQLPNGTNDQILVAGNLVFGGANTIALSYMTLGNGTYNLMSTIGGSVIGGVDSLALAGFVTGGQVAYLATNAAGTEIDLVVSTNSHTAAGLTWTGDGGGNLWDDTNTVAWRSGATPAVFYPGDLVTFDDSGATNPLVNLAGLLAPGTIAVNATNNYTFTGSGSIIGPVSLVKGNAGTLTILTSNFYTGGTLIAGGAVQINNAAALGVGNITNNSALTFNSGSTLMFTNLITGSGSLTNLGGTLNLTGDNSFTGRVVVNSGVLQIGNPFALGAGGGALVNAGATLDLNGEAMVGEPVILNGGTLANGSTTTASLAGAVTLAGNALIAGAGDVSLSGGLSGAGTLTKSGSNTLTLSGTNNLSGPTTVLSGNLLVDGEMGPGAITIASGATLGGNGSIGGVVTNQAGGSISLGTNFSTLAINNTLTLNSGSTTLIKVGRVVGGPANDSLTGISTLSLGGALVISLAGYPVQDGDTFKLFSATNVTGAFDSISLPWLYSGYVWDTSNLSRGVLRVAALPAMTTFAQRRLWTIDQAVENPGAVDDGFVQAEAYFTQGLIAEGRSAALTASQTMTNSVQTDFFNLWPAMDCYIRFNQYLDPVTKGNIETNITTCTQYAGTVTANLYTLGHVIRYLGSEQFGEAAFATNAIWSPGDPNAYNSTLALLASVSTNGYGETASRPYYEKNLLPILTLAQLATNPIIAHRAMLAFQAGLSQNAGVWLRGHLGLNTSRSYPDEETQSPMGSMRTLWVYFGGDAPPDNYTYAALAAVMNYEPLPVIQMAATNRATPYLSRGGYFGAQQNSYVDRDYILFSEGPEYYGNFQVYPSGAMWGDTNNNHFSQLWLCAPWNDDPSVVSGSWPHGMNRAIYSETQCRDSVLQIYNFGAGQTNPPPYALCYVPGGWQAQINDALTTGKIFLHYGTMLLAISCDQIFKWDTNSSIYAVSQSPTRPGDSEFRVWGQPITAAMQTVTNLANSYLGAWTNQFAMALETARPDLYPGATPADQLAAFRADIYTHSGLGHVAGYPPTGCYTNRHGDTLQVKQTSALTPSPIVINGQTLSLTNWPLTDNPWIYQPVGGNLTLYDGTNTIFYDFNAWTVTTNASVPPPSGLLAAANSNAVYLSWSPRVGTIQYNVWRSTVSGGPYALVGATTNNLFQDSAIASAMTYYYVVTATNLFGQSTNSNEAAVITLPAFPSGMTASVSGRMIQLSWNAVSGATSYNLKRAASPVGPFVTVVSGLTTTHATDQIFPVGGNYDYVVSAVNAAGEGPVSTPVSASVPMNYFAGWSNRCAITFGNYTATETLSNFPALIILSTNVPNFSYSQFSSAAGADLRFSDAAQNELSYEIEQWNPGGNSYIWVQIPALSSNTLLYAWWGNPAAATSPAYLTNGTVWSGGYVGVWHLNQTPPTAERDSTGNGFSATPNANLNSASQQPGLSAGSLVFNGVNSAMNIPNTNALGLTGGRFTLSAWVNLQNATNGVIIGKGQNNQSWYSWFMSVGNNPGVDQVNPANHLCVGLRNSGSTGDTLATQTSAVTLSNWVQVAGTLDGGNLNLYINGQLNGVTPTTATPYSNTSQLWIGADSGRDYLNGQLDELRVANVALSPNWIAASYENMASNAFFNTYGPAGAVADHLQPNIASLSLSNGQPAFLLGGAAGFTYIVQTSTNLQNWSNIFTNPPGPLPAAWTDHPAGGFSQRYYRILLAP